MNMCGLVIFTLAVRLFVIYHPSVVVFDEVHFGGFANNYLNQNYYLDVHPPLAKMLIALIALIGGVDPTYRFDAIGLDYLESHVPYILLRTVSAVLGALMVPFAYVILKFLGVSRMGCLWTSGLVAIENIFIAQFRLILLDSYLSFGTALSAVAYICFRNEADRPFAWRWWLFGMMTGVGLGFTVSCKWVGLFTIGLIGLFTVQELWEIWGNSRVSIRKLTLHFFSRLACLLFIPIAIYVASFYAHIQILNKTGLAGVAMSLEYQQDFIGGEIPPVPAPVGYGSVISLRHKATSSYLHSHHAYYPSGSHQQQVTAYGFPDANSSFRIVPKHGHNMTEINLESTFIPLRHGDKIRLEHVATRRYLHSHNVPAPVSINKEHHFEVSCYGSPLDGIGDTNDDWIVLIVDKDGKDIKFDGTADELNYSAAIDNEVKASILEYELPFQVENAKKLKSVPEPAVKEGTEHPLMDLNNDEGEKVPEHDNGEQNNATSSTSDVESEPFDPEKEVLKVYETFQKDVKVYPAIQARTSYIKFVHPNTFCHLSSFSGKKLPDWGFGQQEVTCGRDTLKTHATWIIETNSHPLLDNSDTPMSNYHRLGFFEKFLELNIMMVKTNAKLTASHYFGSRPHTWPFLSRGLGFWNGFQQGSQRNHTLVSAEEHQVIIDAEYAEIIQKNPKAALYFPKPISQPKYDEHGNEVKQPVWKSGTFVESPKLKARHSQQQIYLIGNPLIWWTVTLFICSYLVFLIGAFVYRHIKFNNPYGFSFNYCATTFLLTAFWLHYLPFFAMGRQLFLHHYLPAYYFGILFLGSVVDSLLTSSSYISKNVRHVIYASFFMLAFYVTLKFAPLSYGLDMNKEQCMALKWFDSWDFDCSGLPSVIAPSNTGS